MRYMPVIGSTLSILPLIVYIQAICGPETIEKIKTVEVPKTVEVEKIKTVYIPPNQPYLNERNQFIVPRKGQRWIFGATMKEVIKLNGKPASIYITHDTDGDWERWNYPKNQWVGFYNGRVAWWVEIGDPNNPTNIKTWIP